MTVPELPLITAPHCRIRLTVPWVVGFHVRAVGTPTLKVYPSVGMLKGLALLFAEATAAMAAIARVVKKRIMTDMYI